MKKIALLIFLAILSSQTFGQENPKAINAGVYVDKRRNLRLLTSTMEEFLERLSQEPNTTKGVIISYQGLSLFQDCNGKPSIPEREIEDFVREKIAAQSRSLSKRVTYILGKERLRSTIEFWLVPANAKIPKPTYLDSDPGWCCPNYSVVGVGSHSRSGILKFSIILDSGVSTKEMKFRWKVSEGKIVRGQGTAEIWVDVRRSKKPEVTATAEFGMNPASPCAMASFTTILK